MSELKRLKEEFNNTKQELRKLANLSESELDDKTIVLVNTLRSLHETQEKEIRSLEDEKNKIKQGKNLLKKGEKMDAKEMRSLERRAAEMILRSGSTDKILASKEFKEYRDALSNNANTLGNATPATNGNGGITVPTSISETIIKKAGETAHVFDMVGKITSTTGNMEVIREKDINEAGFVGELVDVDKKTVNLDKATLSQKRCGAAMQLTEQLINDSGVDIVNYSTDYLSRGLSKAVEKSILVGTDSNKGFESITAGVTDSDHVVKIDSSSLSYEDLIGIYTTLNPEYLDNAAMIVSRPMFQAIAKLKDGDGSYLIVKSAVQGETGYKIFGNTPLYVSDALNDSDNQLIFGNFSQGYKLMIKQGMGIKHVTNDTAQAMAGGHLVVLDAYMDGAVVNPDAFIVANTGKSAPAPKVEGNKKN